MNMNSTDIRAFVEDVYRNESRRILSTLIRLLGDFEVAEEAMHDAFAAAMEKWNEEGIPANPRAWLVSTGRFRAIDTLRRRSRFDVSRSELVDQLESDNADPVDRMDSGVEDDELRLIFTCCHPALSEEARVALTLREVCGLTTEEIARAFLTSTATIAQRIVRAKTKIRDAHIPYQVPTTNELPKRLDAVLQVIYLVFNEGYSASSGASLTRADLSREAIRLGRLLVELLGHNSDEAGTEVLGLLALMLLQESRRSARTSDSGDVVLLEDQDRSLWNRDQIEEGTRLMRRAMSSPGFGVYSLQAAIAAEHAKAARASETDWMEIIRLYDLLMQLYASPVIELNRAVAIAMRDGPQAGLELIDGILDSGKLADYRFAHSARAEMHARLGRKEAARISFERALSLTESEAERRFLENKLAGL